QGRVIYEAAKANPKPKRVISSEVAYLITEGLRAVMRYGTAASTAELSEHAVGKTGTSNDSEDNWFVGYSPNILTAVWMGTDEHLPMAKPATGSSLALPLWHKYMTKAFALYPPPAFEKPNDVIAVNVDPRY